MDIGRILSVLWKRKVIIIGGVIAGLLLSFLSLYKFDPASSTNFLGVSPRIQTMYKTTIRLILDEPGFALGRVELDRRNQLDRIKNLAAVYSYFMSSDQLIAELDNHVRAIDGRIDSNPVEGLPMIEISVTGNDPEGVREVAREAASSLIAYIQNQQNVNKVPTSQRIVVREIGAPSYPIAEESRKAELALVIFALPILFSAFLAFAIENLRENNLAQN